MGNKTPYELRLDVMHLASQLMQSELDTKQNAFNAQLNVMNEELAKGWVQHKDVQEYIKNNAPKAPTAEDLLARSSALYSFIKDTR